MTTEQFKQRFPNATAETIRLNAHLMSDAYPVPDPYKAAAGKTHLVAGQVLPAKQKRIRQNAAGLNKTEQAFFDYLKATYSGVDIGSQRLRFKLANGAWYKPDNDAFFADVGLHCYEVKGYMRPKDALAIKVAAKNFPEVSFNLVTKKKGGGWDIEPVLP